MNIPNVGNFTIYDSFVKANDVINDDKYSTVMCSISGGSDSDLLVDICTKIDEVHKVIYVFFDTGIEFEATKQHLQYLEQRYGIEILRKKALKSIPTCCSTYGQPFLSKQVSEYISRLQRHNFTWEDKPFDQLYALYPNCKAALRWWCNEWEKMKDGRECSYSIAYNKYLKEFMVENPPDFLISNKCCYWAKKKVAQNTIKLLNADLNIVGVRKAEGGARSTAYTNCISFNDDKADDYRPIFWYKQADKEEYERIFNIVHSECYTAFGLKRTGCSGCPYNRNFEDELKIIEKHEPKLFKAVNNIFGKSYEYTRKYREFVKSI